MVNTYSYIGLDEISTGEFSAMTVSMGDGSSNSISINSSSLSLSDGSSNSISINSSSLSLGSLSSLMVGNSLINSTSISVGNASISTSSFFLGNSTVNLNLNNSTLFIGNSSTDSSLNSSILTIGNSTVNVTINSTSFSGAVNVNTSGYALLTGAAFTGQVNVGSNVNITTTNLTIGNSTVNTVHSNAGLYTLGGITSGNVTLNATSLFIGNSIQNCSINSSSFAVSNDNTFAMESNGSISLPGGLLLNWGWVSANSSGVSATFHTSYQINAFSVVCSATANAYPYVSTWTKSVVVLTTTNTTSFPCLYFAIGI